VTIGDHECYVNVGFYDDMVTGSTSPEHAIRPGEMFVQIAKHGSDLGGLIDGLAVTASIALQYGVPWEVLETHWRHTRFGAVGAEQGRYTSLLDGIAQTVRQLIDGRAEMIAPPPSPPQSESVGYRETQSVNGLEGLLREVDRLKALEENTAMLLAQANVELVRETRDADNRAVRLSSRIHLLESRMSEIHILAGRFPSPQRDGIIDRIRALSECPPPETSPAAAAD